MNPIHTAYCYAGATQAAVIAIPAAAVPGTVLGYVNAMRSLSATLGRNVVQAKTFRLVGVHIALVNYADSILDVGGSMQFSLRYISPTRARVAAHEAIMREYVNDVKEDSQESKDRQLIVGYDATMTPDPVESILYRDVGAVPTPHRVHLLGASSAGNIGVFADYNTRYPVTPSTATSRQPDQDMFTERASQIEDTISGHATLYAPWIGDVENEPVGDTTSLEHGPYNGPATVQDFLWWAPSGTYIPLFCGMAKLICGDSNWPPMQVGADEAVVTGESVPQRGALSAFAEFFIQGWTPLSSK